MKEGASVYIIVLVWGAYSMSADQGKQQSIAGGLYGPNYFLN